MKNRLTILILLLALPFFPWACTRQEPPAPGTAKIYLEEEGIYRLSHSALRDVGLGLKGVDPSLIRLTLRGQEVPIRMIGDGNDPAIEFYGTANESEYSSTNVYWLTLGQEAGKGMEERAVSSAGGGSFPASFGATLHLEEDSLYWAKAAEGADHWYWQALTAPATVALPFDLPQLAGAEGVLRVALLGGTSDSAEPDHHIRVRLNDQLVADVTWDGQEGVLIETATSHLLEGENDLILEAPGDTGAKADVALLDWVEIRYPRYFVAEACTEQSECDDHLQFEGQAGSYRMTGFSQPEVEVFDITDPANPVHLSGSAVEPDGNTYTVSFSDQVPGQRRYLAVSPRAIKQPTRIARPPSPPTLGGTPPSGPPELGGTGGDQADYIVITHPDFRQSLQPLVEWRKSQGLEVEVVTLSPFHQRLEALVEWRKSQGLEVEVVTIEEV